MLKSMLYRPALLLRLEAYCLSIAAIAMYAFFLHGSWLLLLVLFLMPDVALLGYVLPRSQQPHSTFAPSLYNAFHTYSVPVLLFLAAWHVHALRTEQIGAIWISHIALDRALGFGLKFPDSFQKTHLQMVEQQEYSGHFLHASSLPKQTDIHI